MIRTTRSALLSLGERLIPRKLKALRAEVTGLRQEAEAMQDALAPAEATPEPLGGVAVVYDSMGDRR